MKKSLYNMCQMIYEQDGMVSVIEYCNKIGHKKYGYCKGCETETPVKNHTCLVCGSKIN